MTAGRGGLAAWRAAGWTLAAVLTALAAWGLLRLRFDDDLRSLVGGDAGDFRLLDEVAATFGAPDLDCIVRATARDGDIFAAEPLAALRVAVERLRRVEGVAEVRSIFDVRRQGRIGGLLPVIPRHDAGLDAEARAAAKARSERHPLVAGHMLSADAGSSLVLVRLVPGADRPPLQPEIVDRLETAIAAARAESPALDLELTGMPALREQALRALRRDMLVFNSAGLVLAVAISALAARSLWSTVVACVPPTVGAIWALGLLGLIGAPVNVLTAVVPSLALVVGTCDSIHFIEDMRRGVRRGIDPLAVSAGAVRRIGPACGLTSLVTAVGFASLATARIDAVRGFGIAAAVGALASFAAVTLLTPLVAALPCCSGLRLGRSYRLAGRAANVLAAFSVRHARPLAAVACAATLLLGLSAVGLDADIRVGDSLPADTPAAQALARVDAEFGGAMGVDVVVGWPDDVDWRDGAVLASLDEVHGVLDRAEGISRPVSLASVAEPLTDRARHRLDPAAFRGLVAPDERLAVVRARVGDIGSRRLEGVYTQVDGELDALERAHPGWRFELAGMSVVSARNLRQLVHDLGSSLLLEVVVIGTILAVAFRSPLAGLVSMVPNLFPLAVLAAVLAATNRPLTPATVIVFNVCLGLAVDDTVHLLAALSRHRREGVSVATAVRRAVAEMGNAVVIGGVVLGVGFATVTASSVPSLAGFGVLACAAVAAATVAELLFLPALLVVTESFVRRWPACRDRLFGAVATASP
ncbi:MAG: efflux RND transporter permease subunit [Planctomycetaceae bacterium]